MADNTTATADAALEAVLADSPATLQRHETAPEDVAGDLDHGAWDASLTTTGDGAVATGPTCTPEEARSLARELRDAVQKVDNTLNRIMAARAWEALGYETPAEFILAEIGPAKDDTTDTDGRVSKAHAYRLSRLAMFFYGLAQRIGDDAFAMEMTERRFRQLPAGPDGMNDTVLADRVESRLRDDPDADPQQVLDEETEKARNELAATKTGRLARPGDDTSDDPTDGDPLASLGVGDLRFTDDSAQPTSPPHGDDPGTGSSDDEWADATDSDAPRQQQGMDRSAYADVAAPEPISDDTFVTVTALREMSDALSKAPEWAQRLPLILEYASGAELDQLIENATQAKDAINAILEHAEDLA